MNTTVSAVPAVCVGKTSFPLKPDAAERGPVPLLGTGEASARPWRLLDGPPYANGAPHLGHVLNKHLKDTMVRAQAALGHPVEWRPGWDCHGLPLELAVEKQGGNRKDPRAFAALARQFAGSQVDVQRDVFHRQGWACQWDRPWRTMDPQMEAGTLRVLADLLDNQALEVRHTAVPWCPLCQSTLSGAEQEDKELTLETWLAPFALADGTWLMSWTTTPWTLPLHRGLVVHPHATYRALQRDGQTLWVSQETAVSMAKTLGAQLGAATLEGRELVGMDYRTPWAQGTVVGDERVSSDAGTGVLHAVPGLADLDTQLACRFGWEVLDHLTPDGRVALSPCDAQNGVEANQAVVPAVVQAYASWPVHPLRSTATVAHCWRHKAPLLTRNSRQVFLVLTDALRDRVGRWVEQMAFTPESARARLRAAVASRPDWCLSRQRTWGVPLALHLDRHTGQPHARASVWMRRVADAMETQGVEAWWNTPADHWLADDASLEHVERLDDVLDVWFDSGCVPQLVGRADAVVEGTDQHRGWFQSCLWVAAALGQDRPPFDRVVTHGFVVDGSGAKLSKSTGGDSQAPKGAAVLPPPWSELPTDVVRVWALTGAEGSEKAWSVDTVREATAVLSRWRGVVRFLLANALPVTTDLEVSSLEPWDRWWWQRSQTVSQEVVSLCAQGLVGEAVAKAAAFGEEFSSVALGSWKDRLYCAPPSTAERQRLDRALKGCLSAWLGMLGVLAPRLVWEWEQHGQSPSGEKAPAVSSEELAQVNLVLEARRQLAPWAERLAVQKVPPARRQVHWGQAPAWSPSLLADALDVAQVMREGVLAVSETLDVVCQRCRRAHPKWVGPVCVVCHDRTAGVT